MHVKRKMQHHCYENNALVGAEDHFGPRAGVGTGPYSAFVHSDVSTRVASCKDYSYPNISISHIQYLNI